MRLIRILIIAACLTALSGTAMAEILIQVDKSAQRMTVSRDGETLFNWPVSTGRTGFATPSGSYTTFRMEAEHYSKEWDDAPMPHSIFFTKLGHAIHGSNDTKRLGTPASHGCVRISPSHAATLFALVKKEGLANTKVVLTGSEQVALARHGVRVSPLELTSRNKPQYIGPNASAPQPETAQPNFADRNNEELFMPQGYAQPSYASPIDDFVQQPYIRPRF